MKLTQPFDRMRQRLATGAFILHSDLETWGGDATPDRLTMSKDIWMLGVATGRLLDRGRNTS